MRFILSLLTAAIVFAAHPATAGERLALVIGNASYQAVSSLDNPVNDAELIATRLEQVGFDVTLLINADQIAMKRAIGAFGNKLRQASDAVALFYYAGHGVQSFGRNYLLPVDAAVTNAADLDLVGVEAAAVLRQMFSAETQTNIVILDACRNNPFSDVPGFGDNGLAEMKAPRGTFLAYATAPGAVALDGLAGNSPFSRALAAEMTAPGLPIEQMFKRVRVSVLEQTGGAQTPWDTSSLTSEFVFVPEKPQSAEELAERQFWNAVQQTRDPLQIMLFLRAYPESGFADEARKMLSTAMEQELRGDGAKAADRQSDPQAVPASPPSSLAQDPSEREQALFDRAQAEMTIDAFEDYLAVYPEGMFAEFARSELAALREGAVHDPVGDGVTPQPAPQPQQAPVPPQTGAAGQIAFAAPLPDMAAPISGRSIEQLIAGSPLFPPVEGLPEEIWKGQKCSSCHQWTQDRICQQAKFYLGDAGERSLDKQHPYGGRFKRHLKTWASQGCK